MFKDCFGRELKEGDDILISINNVILAGIVVFISDTILDITYQRWKDEQEIVRQKSFKKLKEEDKTLLQIYKYLW